MTLILVLAIVAGLVFWAIVGYAIWFWGPGLRKRSVWCPALKRRTKVLVEQREPEFGCLRVVDVKACWLAKGPELMCGKECLSHR